MKISNKILKRVKWISFILGLAAVAALAFATIIFIFPTILPSITINGFILASLGILSLILMNTALWTYLFTKNPIHSMRSEIPETSTHNRPAVMPEAHAALRPHAHRAMTPEKEITPSKAGLLRTAAPLRKQSRSSRSNSFAISSRRIVVDHPPVCSIRGLRPSSYEISAFAEAEAILEARARMQAEQADHRLSGLMNAPTLDPELRRTAQSHNTNKTNASFCLPRLNSFTENRANTNITRTKDLSAIDKDSDDNASDLATADEHDENRLILRNF